MSNKGIYDSAISSKMFVLKNYLYKCCNVGLYFYNFNSYMYTSKMKGGGGGGMNYVFNVINVKFLMLCNFMSDMIVRSQCNIVDCLMQGHDLSKCIFHNVRDDLYHMDISSTAV